LTDTLRTLRLTILLAVAVLNSLACTSSPPRRAPTVEDRSIGRSSGGAPMPTPSALVAKPPADESVKLPPGQENAGQPGYYTVKPGDTLIRIGLDNGQNWRDIARWSRLDNPNLIEVGQVLRVAPPGVDPNLASVRAIAGANIDARPLEARAAGAPLPVAGSPAASGTPARPTASSAAAAAAPVRESEGDVDWMWPANGPVLSGFADGRSKGVAIGGNAGDPVLAAADGRVVYAGSGLRGYGNLLIVKHNTTYLTAYAHNQTLMVKEDQVVRRGQKIAEMGASDSDRVELHFEIRKQGQPIDPTRLLPPR
jgi:lipoprotein NlpD